MRKFLSIVLISFFCFSYYEVSSIELYSNKRNKKAEIGTSNSKDSTNKKTENTYKKFMKDAIVKNGMFKVIKKREKIYLEIPKNIMNRNFLISSRVSSTSRTWQIDPGTINRTPLLITFSCDEEKVYVHFPHLDYECSETSELYPAYKRHSNPPIWKSFKIETMPKDSSSCVFDATPLFLSSIKEFSVFPDLPGEVRMIIPFGGTFQSDRSRIEEFKAFDDNIIVKSMMTYITDAEGPLTTIESRNIVLLPEKPMIPRYADKRVGYFENLRGVFDENHDRLQYYRIINHWNLHPKDMEKYLIGELVEPVKPIVWYVDTAIPSKWRKYIKLGITDWNVAFEEIGFKNAIIVKDYPTDDPNFDPDDIHYNCYRCVTSTKENSMGPSWIDPRSGEIICADVISWTGVVSLLNKWMMIQTGAVDPSVRCPEMSEEKMGEAMRYVAAHEIGHTLGLKHNFGASAAFPVEKLRDPEFTQKYGTTPSIMDYARFNYIAQPGDLERGVKLTPPLIGVYDKFAIKYGYKVLPNVQRMEDEKDTLRKWVDEHVGDKMYFFGKQVFNILFDPRSMAEDLGNDVVKANTYGIKNLKYVTENFVDWMAISEEGYNSIEGTYKEIIKQYIRYIDHAMISVGGIYINPKRYGDPIKLYEYVPKNKQVEALVFVLKNLNNGMDWLVNEKITSVIGPSIRAYIEQTQFFNEMLSREVFGRMQIGEIDGNDIFTVEDYLSIIFMEMFTKKVGNLNLISMAYQNLFVDNLTSFIEKGEFKASDKKSFTNFNDVFVCNCYDCLVPENKFEGSDVLEALVTTPRVDQTNKRPTIMKYLRKTYNLAKSRLNSSDEKTREHYHLLAIKMNYLFE